MKIQNIEISPELAKKLIDNTIQDRDEHIDMIIKQRELERTGLDKDEYHDQLIDTYAEKMKADEWTDSGAILLSTRYKYQPSVARTTKEIQDYTIFDGNHRVAAVAKSGKTVKFTTVIVEDADWIPACSFVHPAGMLCAVALLMRLTGKKDLDTAKYVEENPGWIHASNYIYSKETDTFYQSKQMRPFLRKRWLLGLLLHVITKGQVEEHGWDDESVAMSKDFIEMIAYVDDIQKYCDQKNFHVPAEYPIMAREICEQSEHEDYIPRFRKVIKCFTTWQKDVLHDRAQ